MVFDCIDPDLCLFLSLILTKSTLGLLPVNFAKNFFLGRGLIRKYNAHVKITGTNK